MPEIEDWLNKLQSIDSDQALFAASHLPEDSDRVLEALSHLLIDDDSNLRWLATRSLSELDADKAGDLLISALHDNDSSVQHCAAIGLRETPHSPAINSLVSHLGQEDHLLSRLCGDALIAHGEQATSALLAILQTTKNDSAKVETARALALIADPQSITALFGLLNSDSALLVHWAETGLDKMGIGMHFFEPV